MTKAKDGSLMSTIERHLRELLKRRDLKPTERIKVIAEANRFLIAKNKLEEGKDESNFFTS